MARNAGFSVIVKLTDQFTKPIQRVNDSIAKATAGVRGIAKIPGAIARASGLDRIGKAAANVGASFGRLRDSIAGTIAPFARLATIGLGIGLVTATTSALKLGDELIRLSTVTGVSVETLQELQYAAKQSSVPVETMNSSLVRLQKSVNEARKGNKEMVEGFTAAGISVKELDSLSIDQIFYRMATAIADTTDQGHKLALAQGSMGKGAGDMLPVLNESAAGIRRLGDELKSTGAVMTTQMAKDAKAFNDTMTKMGQYVQGIAFQVLDKLLPGMTGAAQGMDDWLKANREWLTTEIVGVVEQIVSGVTAFVHLIRDDVIPVVQQLSPIWEAMGAIIGEGNRNMLAFTAVVAPGIIGAILGIGKAVLGLGVALVANPIGAAIVLIVAAIAGAVYLIWKHWDSIKAAFQAGVDFVVNIGSELVAAWDGVSGLIGDAFDGIASVVTEGLAAIGGALDTIGSVLFAPFIAAWDVLPEGVREALAAIAGAIGGAASEIAGAVLDTLTAPIELVKGAWNALVSFFEGVLGKITGLFTGLSNTVGKALNLVGLGGGGAAAAPAAANDTGAPARLIQPRRGKGLGVLPDAGGGGLDLAGAQSLGGAGAPVNTETDINVRFENTPPGTRVSESSSGPANVQLDTLYSGQRGALAGAY